MPHFHLKVVRTEQFDKKYAASQVYHAPLYQVGLR